MIFFVKMILSNNETKKHCKSCIKFFSFFSFSAIDSQFPLF